MEGATRWALMALTAEKLLQHSLVTMAFVFDAGALRSEVAVDYRWLAVVGAAASGLFAVGLVGLARRRRWSLGLLGILATFDLVGEFVAQGTLTPAVTVSAVVALVILVLCLRALRRPAMPPAVGQPPA